MDKNKVKNIIIIFVVATLVYVLWQRIKPRYPVVGIDKSYVDLGQVACDEEYAGRIRVYNRGTAPLALELKKVTCSCTVTRMPKETIAAGDEAYIDVVVRSSLGEGGFGSQIFVATNDPDKPLLKLGIGGESVSVLTFTPPNLFFGSVELDKLPLTKEIIISPGKLANENSIDGLKVKSSTMIYDLELDKTISGKTILRATLPRDAPIGGAREDIILSISNPEEYTVTLSAMAEIKSDFDISPSFLDFGRVKGKAVVTKELKIGKRIDGDILEVVEISPYLSQHMSIDIKQNGDTFVCVSSLKTSKALGVLDHYIKLRLTRQGVSNPYYFRIPVLGLVKP